MSRPTYQQAFDRAWSSAPQALTACILSGKNADGTDFLPESATYRWDANSLSWVPWDGSVSGGGGGGGGGAVTIADAADVAQGATTDAAVSTDTTGTISGKLRGIVKLLASVISGGKVSVDGSGSTQPVSAASLPLPTGASTEATLALIKAKTDNLDVALSTRTKPADSQHTTIDNASLAVTGSFYPATQPISATSLPLPSNAAQETGGNLATLAGKDFATSAKQDTGNTILSNLFTELQQKTEPTDQQHTIIDSSALPAGAATAARQDTGNTSLSTIAALSKAEDVASLDGDTGIAGLGVKASVPQSSAGSENDYSFLMTDTNGRLWINSDVLSQILNKQGELLGLILTELKIHTAYLQAGLNIREEGDSLRNDPSLLM